MREFKFRGFDIVGGKGWVYGDLVHNKKVTTTGLEDRVMVCGYEVSPDSIGLCTNYPSCNGSLIYEGDIIKVHEGSGEYNTVVVWHKMSAGFCLKDENGGISFLAECFPYKLESIGTIYENPNYLKND